MTESITKDCQILEETDPFLAEQLQLIAQRKHPTVRGIDGSRIFLKEGRHEITGKVGRNDTCPCGSGKKAKKCCLRSN